jgi:hypothetical protein
MMGCKAFSMRFRYIQNKYTIAKPLLNKKASTICGGFDLSSPYGTA